MNSFTLKGEWGQKSLIVITDFRTVNGERAVDLSTPWKYLLRKFTGMEMIVMKDQERE